MTQRQLLATVGLGILLAACAKKKEPAFPYPRQVVAAHEQQHYKTALWCIYTGSLDSGTITRKPLPDSLHQPLQGWLSIRRRLTDVKRNPQSTCFRFEFDASNEAVMRLYNNGFLYSPRPDGLRTVVAVWVNKKDGLVDSVLDSNNRLSYAGPQVEQVNGKRKKIGPPDRRQFSYNIDQPCKAAFLQANESRLPNDLLMLCWERGIIARP